MKRSKSGLGIAKSGPTVVIKVGTSSLIRPELNSLNLTSLAGIVECIRDLRREGYNVVLVSSGAVGVGCQRLGLVNRPSELSKKQALAAVGQVHLMRYYDDLMSALDMRCAQVLLTLDNLANRSQYINAMHTFEELLNYGVIPVVNENDTVAVEQLRIGDNDTLSAHVATLVHADWLFLMTDVDALYTANPNVDPDAKPIREVRDLFSLDVDTSTKGTQWGTGGMGTKITAARIATAGGCNVAICHFSRPANVLSVLRGEPVGTVFHAVADPVRKNRKRWVLSLGVCGELRLDAGAVHAVRDRRASLFSAGIVAVHGEFAAHQAVRICDAEGREIARGLVNYPSDELDRVKGMRSTQFLKAVGPLAGVEEICHRANICVLAAPSSGADDDTGSEASSDGLPTPNGLSRSITPAIHVMGSGAGLQQPPSAADDISQGVDVGDITARLALLQARAEAEDKSRLEELHQWDAELASAIEAERDQTVGRAAPEGEDITEDGWLPK